MLAFYRWQKFFHVSLFRLLICFWFWLFFSFQVPLLIAQSSHFFKSHRTIYEHIVSELTLEHQIQWFLLVQVALSLIQESVICSWIFLFHHNVFFLYQKVSNHVISVFLCWVFNIFFFYIFTFFIFSFISFTLWQS